MSEDTLLEQPFKGAIDGPFRAGQRVRIHWANDNSILEGSLEAIEGQKHDGTLWFGWAGQKVEFWDGEYGSLTYIFGKDDATIDILEGGAHEA